MSDTEEIRVSERALALFADNRTRQLWAEKYLDIPPSAEEQNWTEWYNLIHNQVEKRFKATLRKATDLTPASPEEPFSDKYQERLISELRKPGYKIGAHFVQENATVRIPLILSKADTQELNVHLIDMLPIPDSPDTSATRDFMCMKAYFVAQQVKYIGFKVADVKSLDLGLTADSRLPLTARLKRSKKIEDFELFEISRVIAKEINEVLSDPFAPPDQGQIFKPLDLALLPSNEHPIYRIADTASRWCRFKEFREKGLNSAENIQRICLRRDMEAVVQADDGDRFATSKSMFACSVATIPLAEEDGSNTPLVAVFSWKEGDELRTENFHLGEISPRSERLSNFIDRVKSSELKKIASSWCARTVGHEWFKDIVDYELAILCARYVNPDLDGILLREDAAKIGFPGPPPELPNKPAAYLELAWQINKDPTSTEINDHPTFKAIVGDLSWQNQAMMELADVVEARCRAAQTLVGEHFKEVGPHGGSYVLFPKGELERAVRVEAGSDRSKGAVPRPLEQGEVL